MPFFSCWTIDHFVLYKNIHIHKLRRNRVCLKATRTHKEEDRVTWWRQSRCCPCRASLNSEGRAPWRRRRAGDWTVQDAFTWKPNSESIIDKSNYKSTILGSSDNHRKTKETPWPIKNKTNELDSCTFGSLGIEKNLWSNLANLLDSKCKAVSLASATVDVKTASLSSVTEEASRLATVDDESRPSMVRSRNQSTNHIVRMRLFRERKTQGWSCRWQWRRYIFQWESSGDLGSEETSNATHLFWLGVDV